MILCTLGTHAQPFDRALDWILPLAEDEELVVQHGHTPPRPAVRGVRWEHGLAYEELLTLVREASAVVAHAGVGSMMTARTCGVVPVVIPRRASEGEHVDDHQLEVARMLGAAGAVVPCSHAEELRPAVERARRARCERQNVRAPLIDTVISAAGGRVPEHVTVVKEYDGHRIHRPSRAILRVPWTRASRSTISRP